MKYILGTRRTMSESLYCTDVLELLDEDGLYYQRNSHVFLCVISYSIIRSLNRPVQFIRRYLTNFQRLWVQVDTPRDVYLMIIMKSSMLPCACSVTIVKGTSFFFIYSPHPDFGPRHVRNPISVNHALERKYTYLVRRTRNSLA